MTSTVGIREVAAAARVSTATVSRALRGLPRVSPETRQKVLTAAANLGYVASAAASELARGRTGQKAVLAKQLMRVELPASNAAMSSRAGRLDVMTPLGRPSRGTILVVNGHVTPINHEERAQIEEFVRSEASERGFTVCMKSCTDTDMPGVIRAAAGWAVGIIIGTAHPTCSTRGLHDALTTALIPIVQVRLRTTTCSQNLADRGACLSSACSVVISGAGTIGYQLAIQYLAQTVPDTTG
jgi:3-dehydroquinate dehydratase